MKIKYKHTNIVAKNWVSLSHFYVQVFDCKPVPPERKQSGQWLENGTGVKNANIEGIHLRLPGHGENGPTLEIFQYSEIISSDKPLPNKKGLGHLAFQVDNLEKILDLAIKNGATKIGKLSEQFIEGVGHIKFIYIYDPENNIIELQNWS